MHRFRDMTTYWSKIAEKNPSPSFGTFLWGDPLRIFRRIIPCQKLESWGYQTVYISRSCFRSARHNTGVWQTDRQTDTSLSQRRAIAYMLSRVKTKKFREVFAVINSVEVYCWIYQWKNYENRPLVDAPMTNIWCMLILDHSVYAWMLPSYQRCI